MAPIKQEEQMKDKLEKRRLQPSTESWVTLTNRLDAEQKSKNNSLFWWFGIAASVVGIVFVTALYFNDNSVENNTPTVVNTNENAVQENDNQKMEVQITDEEVAVEKVNLDGIFPNETAPKSDSKTFISEKNQITNELPQEESVAQTETNAIHSPVTSSVVEEQVEIKESTLTFEEQKIQEVVAQINDLKSNGNAVTDAEIDGLLKKAQKEILSSRIYNETTRTVNANALLQDVEADLQQSFRSKVFEALQSGYESVKTAVVQRNN